MRPVFALSLLVALGVMALGACAADDTERPSTDAPPSPARNADVTAVSATGQDQQYELAVTLSTPDTGCELYADWWEVLSPEGTLIYRRILRHSHPDEQPFTRSGGPVTISAQDTVVVRAHLAPGGYGGVAMRGAVQTGFQIADDIDASWASNVEHQEPQPDACAF